MAVAVTIKVETAFLKSITNGPCTNTFLNTSLYSMFLEYQAEIFQETFKDFWVTLCDII
jgi:hypothetical protein